MNSVRGYSGSSPDVVEQYCVDCSFRPWLDATGNASPITYQGRDGRQYVLITVTGGGFFNNPVTDDSIMAFVLDAPK